MLGHELAWDGIALIFSWTAIQTTKLNYSKGVTPWHDDGNVSLFQAHLEKP